MQNIQTVGKYSFIKQDRPVLKAELRGGAEFPDLHGDVYVYDLPSGIYLQGDFEGLPATEELPFHVHDGLACEKHGEKILILPDVMSDANGAASAQIYLDRVNSTQIAGKPIVMHLHRGDTDVELACGLLDRVL